MAMSPSREAEYEWLRTGEEALDQMLAAIVAAQKSVRLEMYIFHTGTTADKFREALVSAAARGVKVKVLVDAWGSMYLPESFWKPLRDAGGQFRWFNPLNLERIFIRDHRKIVVCDNELAFVGGFNIATEYCGDGITRGWRDLGMRIRGPLASELAVAFDDMFECADFQHRPFPRFRKSSRQKNIPVPDARLLLSGPGRNSPLKRGLREDLKNARVVRLVSPYFIPPWALRRLLARLARNGAVVQLIVPAKCDLPVVQMAARSFYRRLLVAGVQIYEYKPQVLHAKLFIIDDVAYAGSANLDGRSLHINYELMIRLVNKNFVQQGREIFDDMLKLSERIELAQWRKSRTFLDRIQSRMARLVLSRWDPFFSGRQTRWWKLKWSKMKQARKQKAVAQQI